MAFLRELYFLFDHSKMLICCRAGAFKDGIDKTGHVKTVSLHQ